MLSFLYELFYIFFIYTTCKEKFINNKPLKDLFCLINNCVLCRELWFKAKSAMVKIYNSVQILWRQTVYGYTYWKTAVYSHFRHIKNKNKISVHRTRVVL